MNSISAKSFCKILLILFLLIQSCKQESPVQSNRVIVGLSTNITTLSPLFAISLDEGTLSELLFMSLIQPDWDKEKGDLELKPMFAKSWQWNSDSSSITFNLRDDVKWSDGEKCTAEDVVFSFDVYSDPEVESRLYGSFEDFYLDKEQHIDLKKTFEVLSPYTLKINFLPKSNPSLFNLAVPVVPKHIYNKIGRKDFSTAKQNFQPVSNGPFLLSNWEKNQFVILKANKHCFLYNPENISEIVFKIIPDYNARLTQLKKGEIDLMEPLQPDDAAALKENENLNIVPVKGREYDYIGWNNIDPDIFNKNRKIVPNKFFGSSKIRKALSYAINRKEILEEYLNNFGELTVTPVTPIFRSYIDSSIKAYPYNLDEAKKLLAEEGWKDRNNNGTIDKAGVEFSFTLNIPSGNPRREYASTIIKNNLKEAGIEVNIQQMDMGVFRNSILNKKINAWMASWFVPIPIELKPYWYSEVETTPMNLVTYQNREVDGILDQMGKKLLEEQLRNLYFRFEKIIHEDEPVTFLYWMDDIAGYNKRIKNIDINPLGVIQKCWNWSISK